MNQRPTPTIPSLLERLARRWAARETMVRLDDHLRRDIGLAPVACARRVPPLVNAWLH